MSVFLQAVLWVHFGYALLKNRHLFRSRSWRSISVIHFWCTVRPKTFIRERMPLVVSKIWRVFHRKYNISSLSIFCTFSNTPLQMLMQIITNDAEGRTLGAFLIRVTFKSVKRSSTTHLLIVCSRTSLKPGKSQGHPSTQRESLPSREMNKFNRIKPRSGY